MSLCLVYVVHRCVLMDEKSLSFSHFKKSVSNALQEKIHWILDVKQIVRCQSKLDSDLDSIASLGVPSICELQYSN